MKSIIKIQFILVFLFLAILCMSLINKSRTDDPRIEKIVKQINKFKNQCEQQKVYLHTDKDMYQVGETVWMRADVLNAISLQADTVSREIYVDLLDQSQHVASSLILRNKKGSSNGYILLTDTLIEGNYQLRAYTSWMRNFDNDYFYYKTIRIKNPNFENVITKSRLKEIVDFNSSMKKKENDYLVSFFPEGGNMVAGLPTKMAFKAETVLGAPLEVKGKVIDSNGVEVVNFESVHDGMGTFKFIPQPDKKYSAKVKFSNGSEKKYTLPQALPKGITMDVEPLGKDEIRVILRPSGITNNAPANIVIVTQSRGEITYISKGAIKDAAVLSVIPKKSLLSGITQITIFDDQGEPVCERLVFISPEPEKNSSKVDLTSVAKNDSIICNIKVAPSGSNQPTGNVSFSAVEALSGNTAAGNENIYTNLLLTSDIKGRINNPSYYFDKNNPKAAAYLDLIMLTNGWRRFVWKEVLADKFPAKQYSRYGGITISGLVFGDNRQALSNNKVILSMKDKFDFNFETTSDPMGKFEFPPLEYEDTADIKIQSIKTSEGKSGFISINQLHVSNNSKSPVPLMYNEIYDKEKLKENTKQDKIEQKKKPKTKLTREDDGPANYYGIPSNSLKVGSDANTYSSIIQYLQGKLAGVEVTGNKISIRGPKTFYASTEPLYIFSGVEVDLSAVIAIPPSDIEKVEVFMGPEASIFGSRGANGALVFYPRRAKFSKLSSLEFKMAGYQKTREFYTPPYESWPQKPESIGVPKTIFWKPNVSINSQGEATVRFKKKFSSEKMNITLEGLTNSGEIVYKSIQN